MFDAVAILLSADGSAAMLKEAAAVQFVMDAFDHLKASEAAGPVLEKAGVEPDDGVTWVDGAFVKAAALRFYAREPKVRTMA